VNDATIRPGVARSAEPLDAGLAALALIANYYRIAADPAQLRHQLALTGRLAEAEDLVRAANLLRMKSRIIRRVDANRIGAVPYPAIIQLKDGCFAVLAVAADKGRVRLVDPLARTAKEMPLEEAEALSSGLAILVGRRLGGAGVDPTTFGFHWFWPSILRYRRPLSHVLVASLFVQLFALATPVFFQLVVDKVLVHKGMSTLVVLIVGMVTLGLFETVLQFLRSYTLSHTTNRIDVELGRRLFHHLFRLPLAYFETRPAGQTVARMRELETIRGFLTGQGLTSLLDLVFTLVFIAVMFVYSVKLTLVVLISIPVYVLIAGAIRPVLREQIKERFNRGARSQQFLVESIVGAPTLKAASVEPMMQAQWEERLAAYVRTSFDAGVTGALGQNLIQYVSKVTTALILFFGAQSVIEGSMSVGELIAFNMIASQVVQPILRLSQLWQDFQQVQVSVARLGDILNAPPEPVPQNPKIRGHFTTTTRRPGLGVSRKTLSP
jgi:ATP-binding cassette, subfamily B, bacterial HlyB/CyaB